MKTITGESLQEVLFSASNSLLKTGKPVDARGKRTLELHPALIKIMNPMKRTLLYPGRGNNPFATLAETIWVFSGSNDITWLNYFLPRALQYSDDGKTWRAGYGKRLISWRGVDDNGDIVGVNQIYSVINMLKKDPTSRQAVITIWDPVKEEMANLRGGSKDYPCTNWLHFMIRDDKLDLEVVMRSNDLIFGFSGINVYEFTCLQEWIAKELGIAVGHYYHYASSLHVYEEHFDKLQKLASKYFELPDDIEPFQFYKNTNENFIETLQYLRDNIYHKFDNVESDTSYPRTAYNVFPRTIHARELYTYLLMFCVYKQHSEGKLSDDSLVMYHTEVFNSVLLTDLRVACNWWLFKNLRVDVSAKLTFPEVDMQIIKSLEEY